MGKRTNHKLCSTCIHAVSHSDKCACPDLSPDVFSYFTPSIENMGVMKYALAGVSREQLQQGAAFRGVAVRAATFTGQCKHYVEKRPKTAPQTA